MLLYIKIFFL